MIQQIIIIIIVLILFSAGCKKKKGGDDLSFALLFSQAFAQTEHVNENSPLSTLPSAYPDSEDPFEGTRGDNSVDLAGRISVRDSQRRTIFPVGDQDWIKFTAIADTVYEISADRLCVTCDSLIYLFDTDGTTFLTDNDDYISNDSRILFKPSVGGDYYINLRHREYPKGVLSYTLSVREFIDLDSDGFSDRYDCNDTDNSVYPFSAEIADDGIDQDCDGTDIPALAWIDDAEADNTRASSKAILMDEGHSLELHNRKKENRQNLRTLHAAGEEDFIKAEVPSHGLYYMHFRLNKGYPNIELYKSEEVSPIAAGWQPFWLENSTSEALTFYIRYSTRNGTITAAYIPYAADFGKDEDGDGYYSQDWTGWADCNDTDNSVFERAVETASDGKDSNCNGLDDI